MLELPKIMAFDAVDMVAVRNEVMRRAEALLLPAGRRIVEQSVLLVKDLVKGAGAEVELSCRVRALVPNWPDPEATAVVLVRGTWDGSAIKYQVVRRAFGVSLVPEGN